MNLDPLSIALYVHDLDALWKVEIWVAETRTAY